MNKEITIYELLGLIKDGQAPKRIIETQSGGWKEEYILDIDGWYMTIDGTTKMNIFMADRLNNKVEIIKENNKIEPYTSLSNDVWEKEQQDELIDNFDRINTILNKLIDEINKLKEDK